MYQTSINEQRTTMRERYFNGDSVKGLDLLNELEDFCFRWRFKKGLPRTAKDINPRTCEGFRPSRVYYSHQGRVEWTDKVFKKFLIRLFYKKLQPYEK